MAVSKYMFPEFVQSPYMGLLDEGLLENIFLVIWVVENRKMILRGH